jgi:hypothetical protein
MTLIHQLLTPHKSWISTVQRALTEPNIRLKQLAVTLCRDRSWRNKSGLRRFVTDALLYVGVPLTDVEGFESYDFTDPINLATLLDYLDDKGLLPQFLTQMLRDYRPDPPFAQQAFEEHLPPLGLDWVKVSKQVRPTSTHPEAERIIRNELGHLLSEVDADYPNMLEGAWEAYYSKNPDRYRHTISSCRELLSQVTRRLTSNKKMERKERIRQILGSKHRTELVESAAALVASIYDAQSAEEHTSPDQATASFVLVETEHILYFLLKQAKRVAK